MSNTDEIILGRETAYAPSQRARLEQKQSRLISSNEDLHAALTAEPVTDFNIAIFEDSQEIIDLYLEAGREMNLNGSRLQLHPHVPVEAGEVVNVLHEFHNKNIEINLVLIDNNFYDENTKQKPFYAADILNRLNQFPMVSDRKLGSCQPHQRPKFLPRIVVTHSSYCAGTAEKLGVAGADKVIFSKGGGNSDGAGAGSAEKRLLQKLLQPAEWDDIQRRACHRLWRELLFALEIEIRKRNTPVDSTQKAREIMAGLMNFVRTWLLNAGVADFIIFRMAARQLDCSPHALILQDIMEDEQFRLHACLWDKYPVLRELCEQNIWNMQHAEFSTRKLVRSDVPPDLAEVLKGHGCHAIGVPLNCRHGFFGTFVMIRRRRINWDDKYDPKKDMDHEDKDPRCFTTLESENLVRVGQRLSLHYEQLLDATLLLRRQRGLLSLAENLSTHKTYHDIIHSAVEFLHKEFHLNYELAYRREHFNDAPGDHGRVTCRLLEPASGLIYRPPDTGEGFEAGSASDKNGSNSNLDPAMEPLTLTSTSMYSLAIGTGTALYRLNPMDVVPWVQSTSKPMRTAMVAPLKVQENVLGAINIEHLYDGFYGPRPAQPQSGITGNENLDMFKAVATVLAQIIHARRQLEFEEALIHLAASTGPDDEAQVMHNLAQALYSYAGPSVILWCEPDSAGQLTVRAGWRWRDPQDAKDAIANQQELLIKMTESDIGIWNIRDETAPQHIDQTLSNFRTNQIIADYSENPLVICAETDRVKRGFPTAAQFSLVLVDHAKENGAAHRPRALGVLALLFRCKNALSEDQKEFLKKFGSFVGTYLASVRRDKQFLGMHQKRDLAEFLLALSHQARHSLKSKLGSLVDRMENEMDGGSGKLLKEPQSLVNELKQQQAELSTTYLMPSDLSISKIQPAECWRRASARLAAKTSAIGAEIMPFSSCDGWCNTNQSILENTFLILIDNALDAFKTVTSPLNEGNRVWCECRTSQNCLELYVCDNGPGFSKEVIDRFGEIGVSTKASSGSGLYWCHRFLPLVNGRIDLPTTQSRGIRGGHGGRGARIKITLQN